MGLRSWIITHRRWWDVLEHTNLVKGTGFLASFTVCDDSITSASALCFFPSAHRHLQIFPCSLLQSFCLSSSCPLMGRYWPITSIYKTTNLMIILVFFLQNIFYKHLTIHYIHGSVLHSKTRNSSRTVSFSLVAIFLRHVPGKPVRTRNRKAFRGYVWLYLSQVRLFLLA